MPEPRPRYGNSPFATYDARIGFLIFELPVRIFSTVRLFGRWPGLMISMRLSKMNSRIGALTR